MKTRALLAIVLICSIYSNSNAASFWKEKYNGWHWYEDKKRQEEQEQQAIVIPKGLTAIQEQEYIQTLQKEALAEAIRNPTDANTLHYTRVQKFIFDRSARFSQTYQKIMQTHPEINETIEHPVSPSGHKIWKVQDKKESKQRIKNATKTHGLFYFYQIGCPYCEKFIPVLKEFQKEYGFEVIPISLDGRIHPAFPNTKQNVELADRLNVQGAPALYLVNTKTQNIIPMSFGFVPMNDLERRADLILQSEEVKQ